ncbi:MAG: type II toxin-antitoxin system RelE/ParE family toxin [Muribaculaceae bacterium]|nr:type II toxin-antitoxin system RelE/ParE family toxin [Muribaculaceae bacterium]
MEIKVTDAFIRCAKPLAKRYRSFNKDYQAFLDELEMNPQAGADLGEGFRKVRMSIAAKGKGKSGGARVITFNTVERNGCLYLIYVYDKSDAENVNLAVIKKIAKDLGL